MLASTYCAGRDLQSTAVMRQLSLPCDCRRISFCCGSSPSEKYERDESEKNDIFDIFSAKILKSFE
jgi:hypothetical protein